MCVSGTQERKKMMDGSLKKEGMINILGQQGGGGVVLNPLHPEGLGGIVVNFTHVFEKCHTFQVWQAGTFSSNLGSQVNHGLKK